MPEGHAFPSHNTEKSTLGDVLVVLAAFIIMATFGGMRISFGIFFKPVMNEFGWTRASTAGAFSLSLITQGLFSLISGRLTDRFGPRVALTISGIFIGTGLLLMSQLSTLWQLYLFYGVIAGIGAVVHVPILSTIARRFNTRRGLATGIVMAGVGIGQLVMPPIAAWMISLFDWRLSYIILGASSLLLIIVSARFLGYPPIAEETPPALINKKWRQDAHGQLRELGFGDIFQLKEFWIFLFMFFLMAFCSQSMVVHLAPYVTDQGIPSSIAAGVLSFMGGAVVAGRLFFGSAADKIGEDKIFLAGFFVLLMDMIALLFIGDIWAFYLFAAVFGFSTSSIIVGSTLIARIYGLKAHAMLFSIANLFFTFGGAVSPYIFGYIYDISNSYRMAFIIEITAAFLGLILSVMLFRTLKKSRSAS